MTDDDLDARPPIGRRNARKRADGLIRLSAALFAVTGLAYLLVPGAALGIVGVVSATTSDFLLRTEGVALVAAAGVLWGARTASPSGLRLILASLAGYYVIGALVDLGAWAGGTVGPASVPSAGLRIGLGVACALVAWRT